MSEVVLGPLVSELNYTCGFLSFVIIKTCVATPAFYKIKIYKLTLEYRVVIQTGNGAKILFSEYIKQKHIVNIFRYLLSIFFCNKLR